MKYIILLFITIMLAFGTEWAKYRKLFEVKCGKWRWDVKTLQDSDTSKINFTDTVKTSIESLSGIIPPLGKHLTRSKMESVLYSVSGLLVAFKREDDGDIHVILKDELTNKTIVCELPCPDCSGNTSFVTTFKRGAIWFEDNIGIPTERFQYPKNIHLTVIGLPFFDYEHGSKWEAGNGLEIHPCLKISITK